jgi:hypothetical protein
MPSALASLTPDALTTESLPKDFKSRSVKRMQSGYLCASLIGAIPVDRKLLHTITGFGMQTKGVKTERRHQDRTQAVLPVRVRGVDASGAAFEELAHTLDLTTFGARLGSIRHPLKPLGTLIVFYRQRRMEFKVIWIRLLHGSSEYQVGLEALSNAKEGWAANLFGRSAEPAKQSHVASGTV